MGWLYHDQWAWMTRDGQYKLVGSPGPGQCDAENNTMPANGGPYLFDLWADPTET